MSLDFTESIDLIYEGRHQEVPPEAFRTIGQAMLLSERGQTPEQIGKELSLEPQQVREIVTQAHGWERRWELSKQQGIHRRYRY